jgi:hypothetical protein
MTMTETRIRAALREGEGERVRPAQIIARAHAVRRQRHRRVGVTVGAAGAAMLLTGGTVGVARWSDGPNGPNAGRANAASAPTFGSAGSPVTSDSSGSSGSSGSSVWQWHCPATRPNLTTGGADRGGTDLIDGQTTSMTICLYRATGTPALTGARTLPADAAQGLAGELNALPHQPCPGPPTGPTTAPNLEVLIRVVTRTGIETVTGESAHCGYLYSATSWRSGGAFATVLAELADAGVAQPIETLPTDGAGHRPAASTSRSGGER